MATELRMLPCFCRRRVSYLYNVVPGGIAGDCLTISFLNEIKSFTLVEFH